MSRLWVHAWHVPRVGIAVGVAVTDVEEEDEVVAVGDRRGEGLRHGSFFLRGCIGDGFGQWLEDCKEESSVGVASYGERINGSGDHAARARARAEAAQIRPVGSTAAGAGRPKNVG
jgi:hypothetical protein